MTSKLRIACALTTAWAAMAASPARAYDVTDWLKLSGFGTVGFAKASNLTPGLEYAGGVNVPGGISDEWSGRLDTRLGVQAEARLTPDLVGTLQVLSKYRYDGRYMPTTEWANLKYSFTPDAAIRVGRFGAPAFMISDSLNVGYAQPWLRPPVDAYMRMPITHIDGVEGIFRFNWGNSAITVQPGFGETSAYLVNAGSVVDLDITRMMSLNVSLEHGPFTVRYGRVKGKVKSTSQHLGSFDDDFNGLGVIYDKDDWLVQTEYVWRKNTPNVSTLPIAAQRAFFSTPIPFASHSAYATVGHRFGSVMPYVSVSNYRPQGTYPANKSSRSDTKSLGVRWDFYRNMAFKAQYDRVRADQGIGLFYRTTPSTATVNNTPATQSSPVNVLSFSIDFVF